MYGVCVLSGHGLLLILNSALYHCLAPCQTSVLIAREKMTQVALRRNENFFSTLKALSLRKKKKKI